MADLTFFQNTERDFIFSNAPENISNLNDVKYTIDKLLTKDKFCDIEYYHYCEAGSTMRIALFVYNSNSTAATITVSAATTATAHGANYSDPATYKSAQIFSNYINGANAQSIIMPSNASTIIFPLDVPHGYFGLGKFLLKSNAQNIHVRVVYGNANNVTLANCRSCSRAQAEPHPLYPSQPCGQFTGEVGYCKLTTNIDLNSVNSFKLCEYVSPTHTWTNPKPSNYYNTNEYSIGSNLLHNSRNFHCGNYGLPYEIYVTNANNKTLKVHRPYSTDNPNNARWESNLFIYVNGLWQELRFGNSSQTITPIHSIKLLSNSQTIKIYHPSGNSSNYLFYFET